MYIFMYIVYVPHIRTVYHIIAVSLSGLMTNKSNPEKLDHLFGFMFDLGQGHVWGYDTFTIGRFCVCVCELN